MASKLLSGPDSAHVAVPRKHKLLLCNDLFQYGLFHDTDVDRIDDSM